VAGERLWQVGVAGESATIVLVCFGVYGADDWEGTEEVDGVKELSMVVADMLSDWEIGGRFVVMEDRVTKKGVYPLGVEGNRCQCQLPY